MTIFGHSGCLRGHVGNISCTIVSFDINSEFLPAYRAVSYAWGSDEKTSAIQIDSKVFLVRANLESLLRSVRGGNYDCWLWIDAISIDQTSDEKPFSKKKRYFSR
jgi:hypothetical protein